MPFRTPLIAEITRDTAVLVEMLVYEGRTDRFVIPAGFGTDFASVPRVATALVPRMGAHTKAAIVHDWFCVHLERGDCPVSAVDADGIFRRIMREEGTSFAVRWEAWAAVRWAALSSWYRRPGWWGEFPRLAGVTAVILTVAAVIWILLGVAGLFLGRVIVG